MRGQFIWERSGYSFVLPLPPTLRVYFTCDRPHSCSFDWGLGWLRGPLQGGDLYLEWSTLVILLGSWALIVGPMLGAADPSKKGGSCPCSVSLHCSWKVQIYIQGSISSFPQGTWGSIGISTGISPSRWDCKLTRKWCIWPLWPFHKKTPLYFEANPL